MALTSVSSATVCTWSGRMRPWYCCSDVPPCLNCVSLISAICSPSSAAESSHADTRGSGSVKLSGSSNSNWFDSALARPGASVIRQTEKTISTARRVRIDLANIFISP